jgi:cell division protein FtsI (penicillin-binding protein 3)
MKRRVLFPANLLLVLILAAFNSWMLNKHVLHGNNGLLFAQAWAGVLVVLALGYASGALWPRRVDDTPVPAVVSRQGSGHWLACMRVTMWTVCWTMVWAFLPSGGLLKLMSGVAFFALVWVVNAGGLLAFTAPKAEPRGAMVAMLIVVVVLLVCSFATHPFRLQRLMADFAGPLDLQGRHYMHGQVLKALWTLRAFEAADVALPASLSRFQGLGILNLAGQYGALPAALLAAMVLAACVGVYRWVGSTPQGGVFTPGLRRFGLALVAMHAVAALLNVLWNFGVTRQPFGAGMPLFTWHATWWVLSAVMAGILVVVWRRRLGTATVDNRWIQWSLACCAYASAIAVATIALGVAVNSGKDAYLQLAHTKSLPKGRLDVADRNGLQLADTAPAFDLWLVPHAFWGATLANPKPSADSAADVVSDLDRQARLLGALDAWPPLRSLVQARLMGYGKADATPKILAWAMPSEVAKAIADLQLPGLHVKQRPARRYPQSELFAHAMGFVGLSEMGWGQDGLELAANTRVATPQGPSGPYGKPLETTLDAVVQKTARDALRAGLVAHHAIGGAAVVIDAESGEIRAMVSAPDFDPNDASTYRNPYQPDRIINRAVAVSFPAAGLFTPLLVAQGIESGRFGSSDRVALGNGSLKVGSYVVSDAYSSGADALSVTQVVAKSSNVGLAKLALQVPLLELEAMTKNMGLGEPLAIPGLMGGVNYARIPWKKWTPMMQATPGLFIETNLMQVMQAYLPIAGNGTLRTPTMLKKVAVGSAGLQVMSPVTVAQMRDILQEVTGLTGTAPKAQVLGLSVAGKTATLTKIGGGRPAIAAFVGMAPAERPQWLVGVLLQFPPESVRYSGDTAAPVFASIVEGLARGRK